MALVTIVEDYIRAALQRACFEALEGGGVGAYVPECRGVLASGDDIHEAFLDLVRRLEDWVKVSLVRGNALPVFDDIDLNSEPGRALATYHTDLLKTHVPEKFYANEEEFLAGLKALRKDAYSGGTQGSL